MLNFQGETLFWSDNLRADCSCSFNRLFYQIRSHWIYRLQHLHCRWPWLNRLETGSLSSQWCHRRLLGQESNTTLALGYHRLFSRPSDGQGSRSQYQNCSHCSRWRHPLRDIWWQLALFTNGRIMIKVTFYDFDLRLPWCNLFTLSLVNRLGAGKYRNIARCHLGKLTAKMIVSAAKFQQKCPYHAFDRPGLLTPVHYNYILKLWK